MKNSKGFTLIELLAVLVVLSVLAILAATTIFKIMKSSRTDLYNSQIKYIESAAEKWALDNTNLIGYSVPYCLTLTNLVKSGHLEKTDLKDPRDESTITGYVKITYDTTYKQFEYKYMKQCSVN